MSDPNFNCPTSQRLSPEPYADFWCSAQGRTDFILPVFSVNGKEGKCMVIATEEAFVYITKEQAMAFYDLLSREDHEEVCGSICEKGM